MTKKIVITGIGAFSPLGATARETWEALLRGESGAKPLPADGVFADNPLPVEFAATVAADPKDHLERVEAKRLDPSSQYALIAGREAFADAGLEGTIAPDRFMIDWGTGIGGVWSLLNAWDVLRERGARRVMPLTVPMLMPNAPAAAIGMDLEARAGIRTAVSACASSTESVIQAYEHLQSGLAEVVIAGGSEAAVHPLPIAAFAAMQALSTRNDEPARASRPYDVDRDGFVLGEGAAALVLETEEHALARGARIYAEVAGGAVTADAYHITAPEPEGEGASRAVEQALAVAGAEPSEVVHINAHATSTPVGDIAEFKAFRRVFGDALAGIPVSATKASTGHLLGGAGAIEAMFTALAFAENVLPPTINVDQPDPQIELDIVTEAREAQFPAGSLAISTSFGFGGHNAVLTIRKYG